MTPAALKHVESGSPLIFIFRYAAIADSGLDDSMISAGPAVITVDALDNRCV